MQNLPLAFAFLAFLMPECTRATCSKIKFQYGFVLADKEIYEYIADSLNECAYRCQRMSHCMSINYNNGRCMLNYNATGELISITDGTLFLPMEQWIASTGSDPCNIRPCLPFRMCMPYGQQYKCIETGTLLGHKCYGDESKCSSSILNSECRSSTNNIEESVCLCSSNYETDGPAACRVVS